MNDNDSRPESGYRKRWLAQEIVSAVKTFPVVVLTGARQVGKSTLLQHEFPDFKYVSLDDHKSLQQAKEDPQIFWKGCDRLIIDEVQRAPHILSAIKLAVDSSQRKIRFLLSGSANLLLMDKVSETLAGRAVYFELLPMSYGEMTGADVPTRHFLSLWDGSFDEQEHQSPGMNPLSLMLRGFMPSLLKIDTEKDVLRWWEGYIRTYLERDLRQLSRIESLIDFRRVLEALALRAGHLMNQSEIARDTGISQPTVFRYLKMLEISNIISRVPAFYAGRSGRITKSQRIFFMDPALSIYLAGYHREDALKAGRETGHFFKTMIFLHLKILTELMTPKGRIFYWRTTSGKEVDFVLEHGRQLLALEVRMTDNPGYHDIENLLKFIVKYPKSARGVLVHTGRTCHWLHSRILAVPWSRLVAANGL